MEGKWTKIGVVATVIGVAVAILGLAFTAAAIYVSIYASPDPTGEVKNLRDDIKRIDQERLDKEQREKEEQRARELEQEARARKEKEEQRARDFEKEIATLKDQHEYFTVSLRNECSEPLMVVVHYRALNNMWVTEGWWEVEPQRLVQTGVATGNRVVYFYALSDSHTWDGSDENDAIERLIVRNKFLRIGNESLEGKDLEEVQLFKKHLGYEDELEPVTFTCK